MGSIVHVSDSGCGGWGLEQIDPETFVAFMYNTPFYTLRLGEGKWVSFQPKDFVSENGLTAQSFESNLLNGKEQNVLSGKVRFLNQDETRGIFVWDGTMPANESLLKLKTLRLSNKKSYLIQNQTGSWGKRPFLELSLKRESHRWRG